jgi:hypothetical protein
MNKPKILMTWKEWLEARKARRATSDRIGLGVIRRKASKADTRRRRAFNGERGLELE